MIRLSLKHATLFALLSCLVFYIYGENVNNFITRILELNVDKLQGVFFTIEELRKFDGKATNMLYLSLLGKVYDVTKGKKHYGPGGSYNFFVGKDASRSFVTGQFSDEVVKIADDVYDLSDAELDSLIKWVEMYDNQYTYKGKLIGRYYDERGHETEYLKNILSRVDSFHNLQSDKEKLQKKHPPCNVEWDVKLGSRVWCTKQSGGVQRDWVGVPRQLYEPGSSEARCACINDAHSSSFELNSIKPYKNCALNSASCYVRN